MNRSTFCIEAEPQCKQGPRAESRALAWAWLSALGMSHPALIQHFLLGGGYTERETRDKNESVSTTLQV